MQESLFLKDVSVLGLADMCASFKAMHSVKSGVYPAITQPKTLMHTAGWQKKNLKGILKQTHGGQSAFYSGVGLQKGHRFQDKDGQYYLWKRREVSVVAWSAFCKYISKYIL